MYAFEFKRPTRLSDALEALKEDEAQALGGGQTLIPALKQRLAAPSVLVSLTGIADIRGICREDDGAVSIGGGTTHGEIAAGLEELYPGLARLAGGIGDPAVRARGTIGGSLANNDPAACYPAAALASDAVIVTDRREIAAADFFQGMFTTALEEGEIITTVRFPVPERSAYGKFEQPASRFALVGVFVAQYADGVRVAVTGASEEGVFRWAAAETALTRDFSPGALDGVTLPAEGLIGDMHATPEYRAHLAGVMAKRAVRAAG